MSKLPHLGERHGELGLAVQRRLPRLLQRGQRDLKPRFGHKQSAESVRQSARSTEQLDADTIVDHAARDCADGVNGTERRKVG